MKLAFSQSSAIVASDRPTYMSTKRNHSVLRPCCRGESSFLRCCSLSCFLNFRSCGWTERIRFSRHSFIRAPRRPSWSRIEPVRCQGCSFVLRFIPVAWRTKYRVVFVVAPFISIIANVRCPPLNWTAEVPRDAFCGEVKWINKSSQWQCDVNQVIKWPWLVNQFKVTEE